MNFWESKFSNEKMPWGNEPSDSAIQIAEFFHKNELNDILIPGIGYGRNAKVFLEKGMNVDGIEISETAIKLSSSFIGKNLKIHHGSVCQMPFDNKIYDGIFCYAVLHLLNRNERKSLLQACYNQLKIGGCLVFTVVSTKSAMYGHGTKISNKRYKLGEGLNVFFYEYDDIIYEFKTVGLLDCITIDEPIKFKENELPITCYMAICKKI